MIGWIVVIARGGHEQHVVKDVVAKGFDVYSPNYLRRDYDPRWRRYTERVAPLYPGYVFVAWDGKYDWGWLKHARGAIEVMREPGSELDAPGAAVAQGDR